LISGSLSSAVFTRVVIVASSGVVRVARLVDAAPHALSANGVTVRVSRRMAEQQYRGIDTPFVFFRRFYMPVA
jgi:hypothetical protein